MALKFGAQWFKTKFTANANLRQKSEPILEVWSFTNQFIYTHYSTPAVTTNFIHLHRKSYSAIGPKSDFNHSN